MQASIVIYTIQITHQIYLVAAAYAIFVVRIGILDDPKEIFYMMAIIYLEMDGMDICLKIQKILHLTIASDNFKGIILMMILVMLPIIHEGCKFFTDVNTFVKDYLVCIKSILSTLELVSLTFVQRSPLLRTIHQKSAIPTFTVLDQIFRFFKTILNNFLPNFPWNFSKQRAIMSFLLYNICNDCFRMVCCFFNFHIIKDDLGMLSTNEIARYSQAIVASAPMLATKYEIIQLKIFGIEFGIDNGSFVFSDQINNFI